MKSGLVIAIEPMINMGTKDVIQEQDGWTISSKDGSMSAHYEHVVAIRNAGTEILTSFEQIERVERENGELNEVKIELVA